MPRWRTLVKGMPLTVLKSVLDYSAAGQCFWGETMRKPIIFSCLFRALAACLAVTLLTAPGVQAATGTAKIDYEVVDGAVLVFGHRLETSNPLPKIGHCEECGVIGFNHSPDGRWISIESDVRFTDNDIWLYDTSTGAMPKHLVNKRHGRHLETNWLSDRVLEVRWTGMGYSSSLLFDAVSPGAGKALADLLLYDAARDVYVRFLYDTDTSANLVEIGSAFSASAGTERFAIALDNEYLSDWRSRIEDVEIDGAHLVVTYKTTARGLVTARFTPQILGGTR